MTEQGNVSGLRQGSIGTDEHTKARKQGMIIYKHSQDLYVPHFTRLESSVAFVRRGLKHYEQLATCFSQRYPHLVGDGS